MKLKRKKRAKTWRHKQEKWLKLSTEKSTGTHTRDTHKIEERKV